MNDVGKAIAALSPTWDDVRAEVALAGLRPRRRRRRIARVAFAGVLAMTVAVLAMPSIGSAQQVAIEFPARADEPEPAVRMRVAEQRAPAVEVAPGGREAIAIRAQFGSSRTETASVVGAVSWRDLARDGEYDAAYVVVDEVRDTVEDLLLAADVMRLSGHPGEAVAPLRQIVQGHSADHRASLAAFTLGRVLLDNLGRPREAADAFGRALQLAPSGPMVEDALARQVEALSRAGDTERAYVLAGEYVRRFPAGRKLRSVRRMGGLE